MRYFIFVFIFLFSTVGFFSYTKSAEVSIYDKAEQMIIMGFRGSTANNSDVGAILNNMNLGGVILFDYDTPTKSYNRNILNPKDLKSFVLYIKQNSKTKPFVLVDEEGGMVSRLKNSAFMGATGSAYSLSTMNDTRTRTIFNWRTNIIKSFGFNMNAAPVLDLCYKNSVMLKHSRCFGFDPYTVIRKANQFSDSLSANNILPIYKHYPGIGNSVPDTHKQTVDITGLHSPKDLIPFRNFCRYDMYPAVMMSHVIDRNVDSMEASLSTKHIQSLKSLGCDTVLIISDDMDMLSISDKYSLREVLKSGINSGLNMFIFSNNISQYNENKYLEIKNTLKDLIDSGEVSKEKIEESYNTIIKYKQAYKVL